MKSFNEKMPENNLIYDAFEAKKNKELTRLPLL